MDEVPFTLRTIEDGAVEDKPMRANNESTYWMKIMLKTTLMIVLEEIQIMVIVHTLIVYIHEDPTSDSTMPIHQTHKIHPTT